MFLLKGSKFQYMAPLWNPTPLDGDFSKGLFACNNCENSYLEVFKEFQMMSPKYRIPNTPPLPNMLNTEILWKFVKPKVIFL